MSTIWLSCRCVRMKRSSGSPNFFTKIGVILSMVSSSSSVVGTVAASSSITEFVKMFTPFP